MSDEPSQRPWRVESDNLTLRPPVCFILDANGAKVSGGFFSRADARLIVDAVNTLAEFEAAHMEFPDFRPVIIAAGQRDAAIAERDRLRDIVRRMLMLRRGDIAVPMDMEKQILAEARAAIGEGKE